MIVDLLKMYITNKIKYESKSEKMKQLTSLLKRAVPFLLLMMLPLATLAQGPIEVTGTVVDGAGEPLIGASVVLKGNTSQGVVTDFDGDHRELPSCYFARVH